MTQPLRGRAQNASVTPWKKRTVRAMRRQGFKLRAIADQTGLPLVTVHRVLNPPPASIEEDLAEKRKQRLKQRAMHNAKRRMAMVRDTLIREGFSHDEIDATFLATRWRKRRAVL